MNARRAQDDGGQRLTTGDRVVRVQHRHGRFWPGGDKSTFYLDDPLMLVCLCLHAYAYVCLCGCAHLCVLNWNVGEGYI